MRTSALTVLALLAASTGCGSGPSDHFRAKLTGAAELEYAGTATFCQTGRGMLYELVDAEKEGQFFLSRFSRDLPPVGSFPVAVRDRASADPGVWFVPTLTFWGPGMVDLSDADSGTVTITQAEPGKVRGSFSLRVLHRSGSAAGMTSVLTGTFSARGGGECEEPGQTAR